MAIPDSISDELDCLPPELKKFAFPSAGAFNCRTVKDTGNRSMHAWGGSLAHKTCEGRIDLTGGAGVENLNLQSNGATSRLHVSQRDLCIRSIGRIDAPVHRLADVAEARSWRVRARPARP